MQRILLLVVALLGAAGPAITGEIDAGAINAGTLTMFRNWSMSPPTLASVTICHGFGCNFRTEISLTGADRSRMSELMSAGRASPEAERAAIGRTEAWFEKRIAPQTGTALRVARAGILAGGARDPRQFDCIDTTLNTNSLLIVLDRLSLLRHHTIAAPISRFLITEGPHNTAVITDRRSGQDWTVDPWTHKGSEIPDIWPVAKWKAGG
jgi:hypothetical protein